MEQADDLLFKDDILKPPDLEQDDRMVEHNYDQEVSLGMVQK
jgi:hypothetical protein